MLARAPVPFSQGIRSLAPTQPPLLAHRPYLGHLWSDRVIVIPHPPWSSGGKNYWYPAPPLSSSLEENLLLAGRCPSHTIRLSRLRTFVTVGPCIPGESLEGVEGQDGTFFISLFFFVFFGKREAGDDPFCPDGPFYPARFFFLRGLVESGWSDGEGFRTGSVGVGGDGRTKWTSGLEMRRSFYVSIVKSF